MTTESLVEQERWLPVPGFDGYDVSDMGRVRSWHDYRAKALPLVMRSHINTNGYQQLQLRQGTGKRSCCVHQMVAAAFIGPRPDGQEVRHLDGDKTNNLLSNLTYGTKSENSQDTLRHGNHHMARKTHCPSGHPYDETNTHVRPGGGRVCRTCNRLRVAALSDQPRTVTAQTGAGAVTTTVGKA